MRKRTKCISKACNRQRVVRVCMAISEERGELAAVTPRSSQHPPNADEPPCECQRAAIRADQPPAADRALAAFALGHRLRLRFAGLRVAAIAAAVETDCDQNIQSARIMGLSSAPARLRRGRVAKISSRLRPTSCQYALNALDRSPHVLPVFVASTHPGSQCSRPLPEPKAYPRQAAPARNSPATGCR